MMKIIAVIYATFAAAKRKPEKKKTVMTFIHIILHSIVHMYDFHIFITSG